VAGGDQTYSLTTSDGRLRTYIVHLPTGYKQDKKYPVLIHLHGGGGSAENGENMSGFSGLADTKGFIAVYPNGIAGQLGERTWDAGRCCGYAESHQVDDVSFIREVVSQVKAKYSTDHAKFFVTGMSNGAMLAQRLACEAADVFAGVATVSGTPQISSCHPARPVPIIMIHGTADTSVPYNGGSGQNSNTRNNTFTPVSQVLTDWATRDVCTGSQRINSVPPLVHDGITIDKITYARCAAPVVLYRLNGGTHSWPGGKAGQRQEAATPTQAFNASETVWSFFSTL
jgi:polyhydroxybutyrate depolymerase